jgi:hypothetical protein
MTPLSEAAQPRLSMADAAARLDARDPKFRIACVESAGEALGLLVPGVRMLGFTKGQISMLDLIRAVLAQTGPAHMVLSTWTAGIRDIENARWLADNGDLLSLRFLTDRSFKTRQPDYCRRLVALFGTECIRVSNTHAKFATLRNERWNICIRGSMNLNRNERWENFDLDDDPAVCDFVERIVTELEQLQSPGVDVSNQEVLEAFDKALASSTCGNVTLAEMSPRERWSRLGYTLTEIVAREKRAGDAIQRGLDHLEDAAREATLSAALGGDGRAREKLLEWVDVARRDLEDREAKKRDGRARSR